VVAGYLGSLGVRMASRWFNTFGVAIPFWAICVAFVPLSIPCHSSAQQATTTTDDWKLVRSVSNPYGGILDLVLIPDRKKRDREYYLTIGDALCGERTTCSINFWTDPSHVPTSAAMPVTDLAVMAASYERSPRYGMPHLRLTCSFYPSREVAELNNCAYFPGATVPWKSPSEDTIRKYQ
jgi:hypothetical protein